MTAMLTGKVALVTGAGSGIGRATAKVMAREGARLAISDVNVEGLERTASALRAGGTEVLAVTCDVTDEQAVAGMFEQIMGRFGRLHCAHNNAGVEGTYARLADTTVENLDLTYSVNLKGVFLCLREELKHMLESGGGAIVNTASIAGIEGARNLPAYVASKHACLGLTRTTALEYASRGIRVNAVCPGPIKTPMMDNIVASKPGLEGPMTQAVPMRRLGEPEEIAEAVAWLCSDRASYVTGHGMVIDGGMTAGS
ncbi:MAG: glucose 1-dehydrogenase [Pseudomonadota bacterium]